MAGTYSAREQMVQAAEALIPINRALATTITTLIQLTDTFAATAQLIHDEFQRKFDASDPTKVLDDPTLKDLNIQLRHDAFQMFKLIPDVVFFELKGVSVFDEFFSLTRATSELKYVGVFKELVDKTLSAFMDMIEEYGWTPVAQKILPPKELGTNGADIIIGNTLGGEIQLGNGNDIFIANPTATPYQVNGGSGDDAIFAGTTGKDSIQGGLGNDTIIASNGARSIAGDGDNDWIQASGLNSVNAITGNAGSDTLIGGEGRDQLFGFNVPLVGFGGASTADSDYVIGGGGADNISGGLGRDILVGDHLTDSLGKNQAAALAPLNAAVSGKFAPDKGAVGNDTLIGYAGNDVIAGGGGDDLIFGDDRPTTANATGIGNDRLFGDSGNDRIDGGGGNDVIEGGFGNDTLTGGLGNDQFILHVGDGLDTITDLKFDAGDRVIMNDRVVEGKATEVEGLYTINGCTLRFEEGSSSLQITNGDESWGVTIENFFGTDGYDPNQEYTHMGITILKKDDDDGIPDDPAVNPGIGAAGEGFADISPIAFDLNGDGIKYQSLADSKVFFDIDGDKFAEHVEWLDRHDGWLARDLNGNGIIDGAQELFGETGGTSAYAKLAALDSNHDGKLTSADAQWGSLRIWRDVNQNGRTDASQIKPLIITSQLGQLHE